MDSEDAGMDSEAGPGPAPNGGGDDLFVWPDPGQQWWFEAGEDKKATLLQLKFAACLARSWQPAEAARAAGVSGNPDVVKSTTHRLRTSVAVNELLGLYQAEFGKGPEGTIDRPERRRIASRLARQSNPMVRLKALELLEKFDQISSGLEPEDDGFWVARQAREFLTWRNGGQIAALFLAGEVGAASAWPMLHDVKPAVEREDPALWARLAAQGSPDTQEELAAALADPKWQFAQRQKIWAEVGRNPPGSSTSAQGNGHG